VNGGSYLQLVTHGADPTNNPGAATEGIKSVGWNYKDMLLAQVHPRARSSASQVGHVVIMAIACLAANIPARSQTAAISGYDLATAGAPVVTPEIPTGLKKDRLARAACEVST